ERLVTAYVSFLLRQPGTPRDLHSFPTRRSSDLEARPVPQVAQIAGPEAERHPREALRAQQPHQRGDSSGQEPDRPGQGADQPAGRHVPADQHSLPSTLATVLLQEESRVPGTEVVAGGLGERRERGAGWSLSPDAG